MKKCHLCGKALQGRSDKKFCDDYCRNQFNNSRNFQESIRIRQINAILRKNRKVMDQLLGNEEKRKVALEKMRLLYYDFNFHTHQYQTQSGNVYHFCYEYGYLLLDNDMVLIVKRLPSTD